MRISGLLKMPDINGEKVIVQVIRFAPALMGRGKSYYPSCNFRSFSVSVSSMDPRVRATMPSD